MANTNDWLVANMNLPDATHDDFQANDVNPENTTLKDKDYYKASPVVQDMFKDPTTGTFNDDKYGQYYNALLYSYNEFAKDDYSKKAINDFEYNPYNSYAPKDAKIETDLYKTDKVSNPFHQKTGISDFNETSKPEFSIREVAQMNSVYDGVTGKALNWSPDDDDSRGLWNFWKKPTLVLGQYDKEGTHYDAQQGRKVVHHAGDYKTDSDGNFFYETLGDRPSHGKEVLSWADTLTKDGSWANKYDFMDSDGIDKSIAGVVTKTFVKTIPFFIPYVGQVYAAGLIGLELTELAPTLIKSGAALFVGDDDVDKDYWKTLNKVQSFGKTMSSNGTSDNAKLKSINPEGLAAMVGDLFPLMYSQKLISSIPKLLGVGSESKPILKAIETSFGADAAKGMLDGTLAVGKQAEIMGTIPGAAKLMGKIASSTKLGHGLGTSYLAASMATSITEVAKERGMDERDTAALFLGTSLGFFGMMTALPIGHWILNGMGLDEAGKALETQIKQQSEKFSTIFEKGSTDATKEASTSRYNKLFTLGKSIGTKISTTFKGNVTDIPSAMIAQGLEMGAQDVMQDAIKGIYNGMSALGITSSKDKDFEFGNLGQISSRYGMSLLGGAIGGAVFKIHDQIMNPVKESLDDPTKKELYYIARNGLGERYIKEVLKRKDKGQLGSTSLSTDIVTLDIKGLGKQSIFLPMSDGRTSQNDATGDLLVGMMKNMQNQIFQEGPVSDMSLSKILDARTDMLIDLKANSPLFEDFGNIINDIIDIKSKITKASEVKESDPVSAVETAARAVQDLNVQLGQKKEELRLITSGEKFVDYQKFAIFGISPMINRSFAKLSLEDYAMSTKGTEYANLTEIQKQETSKEYNVWKDLEWKDKIKVAYKRFTQVNEKFSTVLRDLAVYADQREGHYSLINMERTFNPSIVIPGLPSPPPTFQDHGTLRTLSFLSKDTMDVLAQEKLFLNRNNYASQLLNVTAANEIGPRVAARDEIMNVIANPEYQRLDASVVKDMRNVMTSFTLKDVGLDREAYDLTKGPSSLDEDGNFQDGDTKLLGFGDGTLEQIANDTYASKISELDNLRKKYLEKAKTDSTDPAVDKQTINEYFDQLIASNEAQDVLQQLATFDNITKSKSIDTLNELLKKYAIIHDGKPSDILTLLTSEFDSIEKLEKMTDYEINKPDVHQNLEHAMDLLSQVVSVMNASTNYDYKTDGFNGYNNVINNSFKDSNLGTISQDQFTALGNEIGIIGQKIDFLLRLSKLNSEDKIKDARESGLNMEAMFYEQLTPNAPLFKLLDNVSIDGEKFFDSSITAAIANASVLQNIITSKRGTNKQALPSSPEDLLNFEIQRNTIQQTLYNRVQDLVDKNMKNGGKEYVFNKLFGIDANGVMSKDTQDIFSPIALSHPKLTDFSSTADTIQPLDTYIWLNTSFMVNPSEFINALRGNDLGGGHYDGIEAGKYAPFYSQEYSVKIAYGAIIDPTWMNMAISKIGNTEGAYLSKIIEPLTNTVAADGVPGAGKTSALGNALGKLLKARGLTFWASAPHLSQAEQLQDSLEGRATKVMDKATLLKAIVGDKKQSGIVDEIMATTTMDSKSAKNSKYISKIEDTYFIPTNDGKPAQTDIKGLEEGKGYKKFAFWKLNKVDTSLLNGDAERKNLPDVIFIDEATHLSNIELQLVKQTFDNMSNPPRLVLLGDTRQNGALINNEKHNLNLFHVWRTPKLGSSLRNSNNIKRKNLIGVVNLYNYIDELYRKVEVTSDYTYTNVIADLMKFTGTSGNEFKLASFTGEGGAIYGEKIIDQSELTSATLRKLASTAKGKIGFITDNLESRLAKEIANDPILSDKIEIKSIGEVQGKEYDNTVIDVNWEKFTTDPNFGISNLISNIYTLTSRSRSGTLISDNGLTKNKLFSVTHMIEKDVLPTELDPKLVQDYKDGRVTILNQLAASFPFDQPEPKATKAAQVANTSSPSVPEVSLLSNIFDELQNTRQIIDNRGGVVRSYESDPNKYVNNKIITYPFYNRWSASYDKQTKKWDLGEGNEDMGYLLSTVSDPSKYQDRFENILKNIKASLFYYKDMDMVEKLIGEIDSSLQFNKAQIVIRVSKYDSKFDRTHTANYDSTLENKNEPFFRMALEIPRVDQETNEDLSPVYFTLAPFSSLKRIKEHKEGSMLDTTFSKMTADLKSKVETGPVNLMIDKDNTFDALEVMTNAQLRYYKERMTFDDVKKDRETGLSSPTYLITGHAPIKDTDGDSAFVQWAKDRKLIGRTIYFSTFDPTIRDSSELKNMYISQMIENRRLMKEGVAISDLPVPRVKLVVLDESGVEPSQWISNLMEEVRKPKGTAKPIGLSSSPEMAARIYNSITNMVAITKNKIDEKTATATEKVLYRGGKEILTRIHEMFQADPLVIDTLKSAKYQEAKISEISRIITGLNSDPTAKVNGVGMRYNFKYNHTYRLLVALGVAIDGGMENGKYYAQLGEFAGPDLRKQFFDGFNDYLKVEYPHGIFTHAIYERNLGGKPDTTPITDYVEIAAGKFTTNVLPTMFDSILDLDHVVTSEQKNAKSIDSENLAKQTLKEHLIEAGKNVGKDDIHEFMTEGMESIENKSFKGMSDDEIVKEVTTMKDNMTSIATVLTPKEIIHTDTVNPEDITNAIESQSLIPEIKDSKIDEDSIVYNKNTKRFDFKAENSTFVVEGSYDPITKELNVVTKAPKFEPPTFEQMIELQTNLGESVTQLIQDNPRNAELQVLLTYIKGDRQALIDIAEGKQPNVNYENATDLLMLPKNAKTLEMLKDYLTTTDNKTCKS